VVIGGQDGQPQSTVHLAGPSLAAGVSLTIGTAGGQPVIVNPSNPSAIVIGDTTLHAGDAATVIGDTTVSVGRDEVVLGGSTVALPKAIAVPSGAILTFDQESLTASVSNAVVLVGSLTLSAGGSAQTLQDGHIVSVGTSDLVVDGSSTQAFSGLVTPAPSTQAVETFSIDGRPYTAIADDGEMVLGSTTLSIGGPAITLAGGHIASAVYGGLVFDVTSTVSLMAPYASGAVVTINGEIYSAYDDEGKLILGSYTLSVHGPAITFAGHVLSAAISGLVMDGTTTIPTSAYATNGPVHGQNAILTASDYTLTAKQISGSSGVFLVGSQTLTVGGPAKTLDGVLVSAGASGIIVGGTSTASYSKMNVQAVFTAGGQTLTAFEDPGQPNVYVVDGTSLTVGGSAKTVDGIVVSAATDGVLVGGSSTAIKSTVPVKTDPAPTGGAELFTGGSLKAYELTLELLLLASLVAVIAML